MKLQCLIHSDLPKKITFGSNGTTEYLYDANGTKLKKTVTEATTTTNTHYLDGYQYKEDKLSFFPTAEGYVNVTWASGTPGGPQIANYNYVYNYTDHLGNIRLRYTKNPSGSGLRILEEDHYYPFGLKHQGYNGEHEIFDIGTPGTVVIVSITPLMSDPYKYKFNSMELQTEFNIELYDYGMRNYDPALGCAFIFDYFKTDIFRDNMQYLPLFFYYVLLFNNNNRHFFKKEIKE